MSGTDSKLPSPQHDLDVKPSNPTEDVLPPQTKRDSNRGANRRPRYVTDPFMESRELEELRYKYYGEY